MLFDPKQKMCTDAAKRELKSEKKSFWKKLF
jgi:hypothetical protein